jgi:dienelactone hydrolase
MTDQEFLTGHRDGKSVALAGVLRLPRPGTDRLPAVVLLHGSGGISGYVTDWEQDLLSMGVATFVIDAFTARGIVNTNYDQTQLGRLAMIFDAYRALELLAKHPRIDANRIALMGFSRGGQATLYASLKRFQRMHGPNGLEFAAYIPFYPLCGTSFRDEENVADKPIRIFHGSEDNYDPVAPCSAYVDRLKARGKNVQLTEYAGAGHVFDGRAYRIPVKLEKATTVRHCRLTEAQDGLIVNAETGQPFTYNDPCVEFGPTLAYNEEASSKARTAMREFIADTLRP